MDKIQGRLVSQNIYKYITQKTKSVPFNQVKKGYSLYNSTCPIGINYYTNKVSFSGLSVQNGFKLLNSSEIWNNKKIFSAIDSLVGEFDKLSKKDSLNSSNLNKLIIALLPLGIAKNIHIKDFNDLKTDLKKQDMDEYDIEDYLECEALTDSNVKTKQSNIYLNFDNAKFSKQYEVGLKTAFAHELKHALSMQCTNTGVEDAIKLNDDKLLDNVNKFFIDYARGFMCNNGLTNIELSPETMAKNTYNATTGMKYRSFADLQKDIDKTMTEAIDNAKFSGSKNYPKGFFESKDFWNLMSHYAKDEKEAYQTDYYFRELSKDTSKPVMTEIRSLLYAEMENYFNKKAKMAKY